MFAVLKLKGVDLAYIICHENAAGPIKSYSPDLIVHPLITDHPDEEKDLREFDKIIKRVDVVIVGPGLSRSLLMQQYGLNACRFALSNGKPLVVDGDGIDLIPALYEKCGRSMSCSLVVTPNYKEFRRLCAHFNVDPEAPEAYRRLAAAIGCVVVQKGQFDYISEGTSISYVELEGAPKRCGGQGDILTGLIGTYLAWNAHAAKPASTVDCCFEASCMLRMAAKKTFEEKGRSMVASDILNYIRVFF